MADTTNYVMLLSNAPDDGKFTEEWSLLLEDESFHDCHFLVGRDKERIGAVRCNLTTESHIWWNILSPSSPLAEKGDICLPDIEPCVFRLMLRHIYADLPSLSFLPLETVLKLCSCADKYNMQYLLDKIANHLRPTSVEEVFPALRCLLHHNLIGVQADVENIVQQNTDEVITHPEFLTCDVEAVEFICKQDRLTCAEVALWRAVVQWARSRSGSRQGPVVREWLQRPLKYIRLLTLGSADLTKHIFVEGILEATEIASVCSGEANELGHLCNLKESRKGQLPLKGSIIRVRPANLRKGQCSNKTFSSSCIVVKGSDIALQSLTLKGPYCDSDDGITTYYGDKEVLSGIGHNMCHVEITVTRITNLNGYISDEESTKISLKVRLYYLKNIKIPINGVILKANCKYRIQINTSESLPSLSWLKCSEGHDFAHGTFYCFSKYGNKKGTGIYSCHIFEFSYSVTT